MFVVLMEILLTLMMYKCLIRNILRGWDSLNLSHGVYLFPVAVTRAPHIKYCKEYHKQDIKLYPIKLCMVYPPVLDIICYAFYFYTTPGTIQF